MSNQSSSLQDTINLSQAEFDLIANFLTQIQHYDLVTETNIDLTIDSNVTDLINHSLTKVLRFTEIAKANGVPDAFFLPVAELESVEGTWYTRQKAKSVKVDGLLIQQLKCVIHDERLARVNNPSSHNDGLKERELKDVIISAVLWYVYNTRNGIFEKPFTIAYLDGGQCYERFTMLCFRLRILRKLFLDLEGYDSSFEIIFKYLDNVDKALPWWRVR